MFNPPIVPNLSASTMEDIFRFSYNLKDRIKYPAFIFTIYDDDVLFSDSSGNLFITPYRREINTIFASEGYHPAGKTIHHPFPEGKEIPEEYKWMKKIVSEENWAVTYQKAHEISLQKGISEVNISTKDISISEIFRDKEASFKGALITLCSLWLEGESKNNIGTYIYINSEKLLVCDEYGRTFFIRSQRVNHNIVNKLISAGYKRTEHPEKYVIGYFEE